MKPIYKSLLLAALINILSFSTLASDGHDHGAEEKSKHETKKDDGHGHEEGEDHDEEASEKGPNNGRLLEDGDFAVELALVEDGTSPEYRAWATVDGNPLKTTEWQLTVKLTRLGGQVDTFTFAQQGDFLRGKGTVEAPHSFDVSVTAIYKNRKHHWSFPSYEGRVQLDVNTLKSSGLTVSVAKPGLIQQQSKVYGRVQINPESVSQVSARFPGIVRSVNARVGSVVKAGEVLAQVEANESLRNYSVTAPINGVVITRHANAGEATGDNPLFTVADTGQLIAELTLFPQDAAAAQVGQTVVVRNGKQKAKGQIESLTPVAGGISAVTARVVFDSENREVMKTWTPGEAVEGLITVSTRDVSLRVNNLALQEYSEEQVVFIKVGNTFETRALELGESDEQFTEVKAGLQPGDTYVVGNSYLLKADLEKSGAAHEH